MLDGISKSLLKSQPRRIDEGTWARTIYGMKKIVKAVLYCVPPRGMFNSLLRPNTAALAIFVLSNHQPVAQRMYDSQCHTGQEMLGDT